MSAAASSSPSLDQLAAVSVGQHRPHLNPHQTRRATAAAAAASSSAPVGRQRMLNLHRAGGANELMLDLRALRSDGSFTDLELVAGDGSRRRAHAAVLGAGSDLLRRWMEATVGVNMHYTVILPDVSSAELDLLLGVLYGSEVTVSAAMAPKIHDLADALGVSVDLPFRTDGLAAADEPSSSAPLVCWHCGVAFADLDQLKTHVVRHEGEQFFKRKQHRCRQCQKVLPSMWRLRQHLLTHSRPVAPEKNLVAAVAAAAAVEPELTQIMVQKSQLAPVSPQPQQHRAIHSPPQQRPSQQPPPPPPQQQQRPAAPPPPPPPAVLPPPSDHRYASAASRNPRDVSSDAGSKPATDHLYSAKKMTKEEAEALAAQREQELQVKLKKLDHLYSTPSSPSSPIAGGGGPAGSGGADARKAIKTKKKKKVKRQTIQALGHSYAAARPRRISEKEAGGGSVQGSASSAAAPPPRKRRRSSVLMFPCDQCDKEFPQPYRLNRHIREVHIKEKSHNCRYCDKSFFKLTSRERHELTHTEHDLWRCASCGKCFRDQSSLKYHEGKTVCVKKAAKARVRAAAAANR